MKQAYLAIKYYPDNRNRPLIEQLSHTFYHAGYQTICVVRDLERWGELKFTPQELMEKSFAYIKQSDLIIIDLTEKGVGLGIEAGYAHALNIPILTIGRTGSDISETLRGISHQILFYNNPNDLIPRLNLA